MLCPKKENLTTVILSISINVLETLLSLLISEAEITVTENGILWITLP